jgi:hypothetical protein
MADLHIQETRVIEIARGAQVEMTLSDAISTTQEPTESVRFLGNGDLRGTPAFDRTPEISPSACTRRNSQPNSPDFKCRRSIGVASLHPSPPPIYRLTQNSPRVPRESVQRPRQIALVAPEPLRISPARRIEPAHLIGRVEEPIGEAVRDAAAGWVAGHDAVTHDVAARQPRRRLFASDKLASRR